MENLRIDELARRLLESVPPSLRSVQQDLEQNFSAVLRANLGRLDLVSRDEFDAQARVLERARARVEALEARVRSLEAVLGPAPEPAEPPPADEGGSPFARSP
jgi:BMFP domain-containing protein YqiC